MVSIEIWVSCLNKEVHLVGRPHMTLNVFYFERENDEKYLLNEEKSMIYFT